MTDLNTFLMNPFNQSGKNYPIQRDYVEKGRLQLPRWKRWGLSVPLIGETEIIKRTIFLQNMVAGVLSHDIKKAKAYKEGKLMYYDIVTEIEKSLGVVMCGSKAGEKLPIENQNGLSRKDT